MPNERVFEIYDAAPRAGDLRELAGLAAELERQDMPRVAAFIAEAADAYRARGIVRHG